jgi:hypothetical protein
MGILCCNNLSTKSQTNKMLPATTKQNEFQQLFDTKLKDNVTQTNMHELIIKLQFSYSFIRLKNVK